MNSTVDDASAVPLRDRLACYSCAKAKTRCSWQTVTTDVCERCARLKKQCNVQEKVPRKRKSARTSRAAQLESKLDNIVSLLSSSQRQQLGYPTPDNTSQSTSSDTIYPSEVPGTPPSPYGKLVSQNEIKGEELSMSDTKDPFFLFPSSSCTVPSFNPALGIKSSIAFNLSAEEATRLLGIYLDHLAPHCPFVVIPPDWTFMQLRESKPFSYMAVMLVASYQGRARQAEQAKEVIKYFSEHVLVWGERNLDLLQGLIVYLSWYHAYAYVFLGQQVNNLHALCVSLCIDLSINKAPTADHIPSDTQTFPRMVNHEPQPHTSEEKRALAGCFFLTSMVATCFKKIEAMPYTDYVEECCRGLDIAKEYPSDTHLVERVRLQLIIDEIHRAKAGGFSGASFDPRISTGAYVQHFLLKLQPFRALMSSHLQHNLAFMIHYYHAELSLYEIGLQPLPSDPANPTSRERLEILQSCLKAVQSFVRAFFAIPSPMFFNLSYSTFARIAHEMVVLAKLSMIEDIPNYLAHVKETIDLSDVLEQAGVIFERAQEEARRSMPGGMDNEIFERWSMRIRVLKNCFEGGLEKPQQAHPQQEQQDQYTPQQQYVSRQEGSVPSSQIPANANMDPTLAPSAIPLELWPFDSSLTGGFLDLSDEAFWREVAGNPLTWAKM